MTSQLKPGTPMRMTPEAQAVRCYPLNYNGASRGSFVRFARDGRLVIRPHGYAHEEYYAAQLWEPDPERR